MKKEVILAITIGFGLGLIITYGVWLANKSLKGLPQTISESEPTSAPTQIATISKSPTPSLAANPSSTPSISLTSPVDELLTDKDVVKVEGTTQPNAVVALTYEGSEQILKANSSGMFSADISLDGGYNIITATTFDNSGNTANASLTITYTTSKI